MFKQKTKINLHSTDCVFTMDAIYKNHHFSIDKKEIRPLLGSNGSYAIVAIVEWMETMVKSKNYSKENELLLYVCDLARSGAHKLSVYM